MRVVPIIRRSALRLMESSATAERRRVRVGEGCRSHRGNGCRALVAEAVQEHDLCRTFAPCVDLAVAHDVLRGSVRRSVPRARYEMRWIPACPEADAHSLEG